MTFKLSQRSLDRLEGVDENMVAIAKYAIGITKVDFGIPHLGGLRTMEQQRQLVDKGASQTMKSKHLEGIAIDTVAYVGSRVSWELNLYDDIADAIKQAANDLGIHVRWGAAWHINSIGEYEGTMEDAMNEYIDLRRSQALVQCFVTLRHFLSKTFVCLAINYKVHQLRTALHSKYRSLRTRSLALFLYCAADKRVRVR